MGYSRSDKLPAIPFTLETPGDNEHVCRVEHKSPHDCISCIIRWCQNISGELSINDDISTLDDAPFDLEKLQAQISEKLGDDNTRFTEKEIDNIADRLNELEAKLSILEKENILTQQKFERAKQAIEAIKSDSCRYTKKVWLMTNASRWTHLVKKIGYSKEIKALALGIIKKMIGLP